jgi:hypothetical protein
MSRSVRQLIAEIESYEPTGDETADVNQLYAITYGFEELVDLHLVLPTVLGAMERFPDAWWGNPGPLVHLVEYAYTIERLPAYINQLAESILRIPTPTTLWMVNRLLNSNLKLEQRTALIDVLRVATEHSIASNESRSQARAYLDLHLPGMRQLD